MGSCHGHAALLALRLLQGETALLLCVVFAEMWICKNIFCYIFRWSKSTRGPSYSDSVVSSREDPGDQVRNVKERQKNPAKFGTSKLAKNCKKKLPGIFFVLPCIENYTKVDLRTSVIDIPPQEVRETCSEYVPRERPFNNCGFKLNHC